MVTEKQIREKSINLFSKDFMRSIGTNRIKSFVHRTYKYLRKPLPIPTNVIEKYIIKQMSNMSNSLNKVGIPDDRDYKTYHKKCGKIDGIIAKTTDFQTADVIIRKFWEHILRLL